MPPRRRSLTICRLSFSLAIDAFRRSRRRAADLRRCFISPPAPSIISPRRASVTPHSRGAPSRKRVMFRLFDARCGRFTRFSPPPFAGRQIFSDGDAMPCRFCRYCRCLLSFRLRHADSAGVFARLPPRIREAPPPPCYAASVYCFADAFIRRSDEFAAPRRAMRGSARLPR